MDVSLSHVPTSESLDRVDIRLEYDAHGLNLNINALRDDVRQCDNATVLMEARKKLDTAQELLDAAKREADSKIASQAFAGELVVAA